jgi:hypothetical protein
MFACKKRKCCGNTCGNGCGNACGGCSGCNGGGNAAAEGDEAAPMPPAPMADPSASVLPRRQVVKATATGSVVRRHYR